MLALSYALARTLTLDQLYSSPQRKGITRTIWGTVATIVGTLRLRRSLVKLLAFERYALGRRFRRRNVLPGLWFFLLEYVDEGYSIENTLS